MKFAKNVLALSIALAVSGATAATKQQEDDSVHQWGRWAVLVPEAGVDAGPFIKTEAAKDLRPEDAQQFERIAQHDLTPPGPPASEGHCQAGASCSYATYEYNYNVYNGYGGYGEGGSTEGYGARVPANIEVDVQFAPVDSVQVAAIGLPPADGGEVGVTADFSVRSRTPHPNYPPVSDRHTEEDHIHDYGDDTVYWHASNYEYFNTAPDGGEGNSSTWSDINGGMAPGVTEDTTAGWWRDGAEGYSYDSGANEWFRRMGSYVAGTATNTAYLDTLNAGNVQANYVGFAMHSGVPVEIQVDFGDSSWRGTWNGGRDGYVNVATDENGVRHVEGEVGFRVDAGHLSGPNLIADRLSASDGRVRGSVEGSFFGSQAQVVGGLSDITKTVTADTVGEGGVTYNAARNVDTFVTVKEQLADRVGDIFRGAD